MYLEGDDGENCSTGYKPS